MSSAALKLDESVVAKKTSYGEILKSTALVGGSSVLNIGIGIIRTKAMAMLLGPAGFGLMGLYSSILELVQSVASMGVNSSGVRQIAEAAGSEDQLRIARTTSVVKRVSVVLGLLGAILLVLISPFASAMTFGSTERAAAVALLSIAVFLRVLSGGQSALIQGTRRIADLAKMNVLGASIGTLASIPIVYFYREQGVVPALVVVAAASLGVSWWYSRDIENTTLSMPTSELLREASSLLKLGFAFMASGLMMMGSAYAVRVIISHKLGMEATGLYHAAWTLGGLYVGLILQAMGADFYPRLTGVAFDDVACNRLVNEQAHVGMLLAGPGIVATLALAPVVVALFYSANFSGAVETLRWICLGVALRVITWPMGYIIIARGEQGIFFWTELAWTVMNLGLTWVLIDRFGLTGVGMAFLVSYVLHGCLINLIVRRLSAFQWAGDSGRTGRMFVASVALCLAAFYLLPQYLALAVGSVTLVLMTVHNVRSLVSLIGTDRLPRPVQNLLRTLAPA